MIRCTCLISSFDSGEDVSGGRRRWASLPYCLGSGDMGSVGDVLGNRVCIFGAACGCSPAWRCQGCGDDNPI